MHRLGRSFKLVVAMVAASVAAAVTSCTPATVPPAGLSCAWAYKTDTSAEAGGTYTVEVAGTAPIGSPDNVINPNGVLGSVIYRVYLGNGDPTGGVGLPQLLVKRSDGTVVPVPTCGNPGTDAGLVGLVNTFGPATDVPASDPPVFKRPATLGGLYVNPDNGYVAAVAAHSPGSVVVVRGTAPTVPDTQAGISTATPGQLRYWSLCSNEYRKPYPVTDCVHDTAVPVAPDGTYTIVVSTAEDRPANATTADGVAWLDWGSTDQDILLLMRHMLPAGDFTQSVFEVAPGQVATAMGPYQPVATTCSTSSFESAGAGCA